MYHYLFTNDLRISVLDESLKKAGHCFATNTVPSSTVDKSANNNMMTLGFYFTLTENSNCAKVAAAGNTRAVVLNFIKKFQFPNMRTSAAFNECKEDGIKLAPMRVIVKLLYTMNLLHGELVAHLSKDEIKNFIFYNDKVAKKKNPDIGQLITDILEYRKTGIFPESICTNEAEHEWKHEDRQIREMLKVLQWSGCITEKEGNYVIDNDELSNQNKADVFDIITCDTFWEGSTIESYREYMDMPDIIDETDDNSENVNDDCEEVFNHNLFGIHIKEKNNALSEENPHVCIGWSAMGDLSNIDSKDELAALYDNYFEKNNRGKGQDVGQVWRFLKDMQIGDYVIFAEHSVFHIGRIESDYYYDDEYNPEQSADYKSSRKVRWLKTDISRGILSRDLHNSLRTAMSIWTLNDYKSAVSDLLRGTYQKDDDREEVVEEMMEYIEPVYNTDLETQFERNRIVFGAPGTGKSYKLKDDSSDLLDEADGTLERVTFHPDYSYAQFVGTYKPVTDANGDIRYAFVPGPFMRVYVDAIKSGRTEVKPHLLLIEEINRAKVAAVFGDVFQLLDRDDDGVSEYEIQTSEDIRKYLASELGGTPDNWKKIKLPNNMFIWATMNSADQGVFPMDTAFKRRWSFEYLGINQNEEKITGKIVLGGDEEPVVWNKLRKAINDKLAKDYKVNEDKLMGPFFLSKKVIKTDEAGMIADTKKFIDTFKSKVIMYLYEDAAKQHKHKLFSGCDSSKYSSVCDAFEEIGMGIFGEDFKANYYDQQEG